MTNQLSVPDNWKIGKIKNLINKIPLTGIKLKKRDYQENGKYPVIDQGQEFIGGYTDEEIPVPCEPPVIVFGDHTKEIKFINYPFVAGADGIKVIKPKDIFEPKLFYYFIQAIQLPDKGYARHFQYLEKELIPIPPKPDQNLIVSKIEELFSQLDAGVAGLKRAQAELQRYRASVLKAAFEGRLVPQDPNDEPAISILNKIGKSPINRKDLENLPEGWVWTKVGDISNFIYGKGLPKYKRNENGGIPVYGSNGVIGYHSDYLVEKPCLIIGRKGASGAVQMSLKPCWPIDTAYYFIPPEDVDLKFLFYLFSRLEFSKLDSSTAIPSLRRDDAHKMIVPLPPLAEQNRIVECIERKISVIESLEKTILENINRSKKIRQSILNQAFIGQLIN